MCSHKRKSPLAGVSALVVLLALGVGLSGSAGAISLEEALTSAYVTNPDLKAAQAELRNADELVPQARSGYMPSLSASGTVSRTHTEQSGGLLGEEETYSTMKSADLQLVQPLYRGGRTMASIRQARNLVRAQRALLASAEQTVLLDAAVSYLNVVQFEAVVGLTQNNENVLNRQLEASQDRFRVGEITRTDVSQSESRQAGARASRIQAEGQLRAGQDEFERVVGLMPGEVEHPELGFVLPQTMQEAIDLALQNNPQLNTARYVEAAARDGARVTLGQLLPTLNLVGTLGRTWGSASSVGYDDIERKSVSAQLSVPLYQSGAVQSSYRQAKEVVSQRLSEVESTTNSVRQSVISAWESLVSAQASIQALEAQVDASSLALEGVRQEAQVGSRTTLDILDAEQELLNAQVQLVEARRDEAVARFNILALIGRLTVQDLGLPVEAFDPMEHYDDVKWKMIGLSGE